MMAISKLPILAAAVALAGGFAIATPASAQVSKGETSGPAVNKPVIPNAATNKDLKADNGKIVASTATGAAGATAKPGTEGGTAPHGSQHSPNNKG